MKWQWDDNAVKSKLATDNVATMLVNKMKRFGNNSQDILKVAAVLGAKFRASMVATVIDNVPQKELRRLSSAETEDLTLDDTDVSTLNSSVHEFEEEGLLEKESEEEDDVWNFVHDRVQSAAIQLIPLDKQDNFRGEIGSVLMEQLDPDVLDDSLFAVVSLCNYSIDDLDTKVKRKELAAMNLKAGVLASDNAAFDAAAVYFQAAYKLMSPDGWEYDHNMMVKVCSEGSRACFICGDTDSMNKFISEVISRDDVRWMISLQHTKSRT